MKKLRQLGKFKSFSLVMMLVLGLALIGTTTAYAAGTFTVHTTTVKATVNEALSVSLVSGEGTWDGGTWTVAAYPNEIKTLVLKVSNVGSVDIVVSVGESTGKITGVGNYNVPAGNSVDVTLTWAVPSDEPAGTQTFYVTFNR